jgi:hypothetical protein
MACRARRQPAGVPLRALHSNSLGGMKNVMSKAMTSGWHPERSVDGGQHREASWPRPRLREDHQRQGEDDEGEWGREALNGRGCSPARSFR